MKNPTLYLLFLIGLFYGCAEKESLHDWQREMISLTDSYFAGDEMSQKREAARYLIREMEPHISLSPEWADPIREEIASRLLSGESTDDLKRFVYTKRVTENVLRPDRDIVDAQFIIDHVESAFDRWYKSPWARHLTFDEFCEYLLPYKYSPIQTIDHWRDTLASKYSRFLSMPDNDEFGLIAQYVAKTVHQEINRIVPTNLDNPTNGLFFNAELIDRLPFGDCGDYVTMKLAIMRSLGIPVAADFIPQWGHRSTGNHKWLVVLNNTGRLLPIPHLHQNPGDVFFPEHTFPKIYRERFAAVPDRKKYVEESHYVFDRLTLFHEDVTHEYTKTYDVTVTVRTDGIKDKYYYIATSSFRDWKVVDFGTANRGRARFKNMGVNTVYMVWGYDGENLIPVSEPFLLRPDGSLDYFIADLTSLSSDTIRRKNPKALNTAQMENRFVGCRIEATNDPNGPWTTVYEIEDLDFPDRIPFTTERTYRYWRFRNREWSYLNIAEFQLFGEGSDHLEKGRIISSGNTYKDFVPENAFDGDWLTFYHSDIAELSWVGLDLGEPKFIEYARCVPRSDDNGIHYGDIYELMYWADGQWTSLGRQKSAERYLVYDSIPEKALLLLKNHTRGREERIFTMEDGKQVWR